jgi:hypothetical protein
LDLAETHTIYTLRGHKISPLKILLRRDFEIVEYLKRLCENSTLSSERILIISLRSKKFPLMVDHSTIDILRKSSFDVRADLR